MRAGWLYVSFGERKKRGWGLIRHDHFGMQLWHAVVAWCYIEPASILTCNEIGFDTPVVQCTSFGWCPPESSSEV